MSPNTVRCIFLYVFSLLSFGMYFSPKSVYSIKRIVLKESFLRADVNNNQAVATCLAQEQNDNGTHITPNN